MRNWAVWLVVMATIVGLGGWWTAGAVDFQWEYAPTGERAWTSDGRGGTGELGSQGLGLEAGLFNEPITMSTRVAIDERAWLVGDFIELARLAVEDDAQRTHLAIRATVTSAGFFGTVWRTELVSETGLLGDVSRIALPGLERHLLETGRYSTTLSYDPVSGQVSVRMAVTTDLSPGGAPSGEVTLDADIPEADRSESDPSEADTSDIDLASVLVDGLLYVDRSDEPSPQSLAADDSTRWRAGVAIESAQLNDLAEAVKVEHVHRHAGFHSRPNRLALRGARTVVRSSGTAGSGQVLLNQDPLVFVVLRDSGVLPGSYRLNITDGPTVAAGDASAEPWLFHVAAGDEVVEVPLGVRTLPAGSYTGDVTYVEYDPHGDVVFEQLVATVGWEVVPPMVDVGFELSGRTMQTITGLPAELRGHVVLQSNQAAHNVHVVVTTDSGDVVVDATRDTIRRGETRIPFAWTVEDEHARLTATVTGADGMPDARHVFSPFGVTDALLTSFTVHVEAASYFGDVPQQTAVAGESLVRVWAGSPMNVAQVGDVVVDVQFTSPSGQSVRVPARRITLQENADPREQTLTAKMTGLKWAQIQATDQRHWFADIKPVEPGLWRYKVDVINPHARLEHFSENPFAHEATKYWRWHDGPQFPGRFTVAEGVFDVLEAVGAEDSDTMSVRRLTYIEDSTVKLEQVTGDWDKHLHRPTINQTLSRASVAGTDLGRSFEHEGDLILLFGDTVGPDGFIQSFVARSTTKDPEAEGGLHMDVYTEPFRPHVALRLQPPGIGMGGFEVPTGGISLNGNMYILVRTSFQDPYGRSVLLVFDEARSRFRVVREFSPLGGKFTEVEMRLSPEPIPGLPDDVQWVLLWGTGERYRQSPVYLGAIPADAIEETGVTKYFAGVNDAGDPVWGDDESDAVPVIAGNVGEFSIIRVPELNVWVSMHADLVSWSTHPWGPWSPFVHLPIEPVAADAFQYRTVSDKYLAGPTIGPEDPYRQGGPYGHYMIERFTQVHDDVLRLYYLISTWNPYEVVLMRSDLRIEWE